MKNKHIQYLVLLALFTIGLDRGLGWLYETAYFSETSRKNDRLIHSVLGTNEDILIFGSSRALHHYNPQIIEDSLGMTCFNVGSGGQNIYYHLALLEATLERYTPKMAILELMNIDFEVTPPQWDTEKLGVLLPFVNYSESIKETVQLMTENETWKLVSQIYPFNSTQYVFFRNNYLPYENYLNLKGFVPINRNWVKSILKKEIQVKTIDKQKIIALDRFIEVCSQNNIQLYIFVSPYFANLIGESAYSKVSTHIKENFDIFVINHESDSLFKLHPEYFADQNHLNRKGADIYTKKVLLSIDIKN